MEPEVRADEGASVQKVLVVDDDADINRLLRTRLSTRGYQVESAANGEEALASVDRSPPDLIFLDVSMPGIGGLEVLRSLRARGLDLAVIMTTAFGSEQVAIEALRQGADDYLRKPFEREEFQMVLTRTVGRLRLGRQNAALRFQLDEKRRQLEAELARAASVQADLLPRERPCLPGVDLAARCLAAREVGGDFYDWRLAPDGGFTFVIGDVMGKGMAAALLMATVRAALRAIMPDVLPAAAVTRVDQALGDDLTRSGAFVTLFLGRLEPGGGQLRYVDAGHGHCFVRRAAGNTSDLVPGGLPLGILPDEPYVDGLVRLESGDALILYSDGLVESRGDTLIGRDEIAEALVGAASAAEMVDRLIALAGDGSRSDDLTVLVLRATEVRG